MRTPQRDAFFNSPRIRGSRGMCPPFVNILLGHKFPRRSDMNAPTAPAISIALKDPQLFRSRCYVAGEWIDAESGKTIPVTNPATGETLGTVPNMGAAETRRAIDAANAAWPAWRAKVAKERAAILRRWADLMVASQEDLAIIMTAEQGKPLAESRGE